jgi:hypothetical protein
MMGAMSVEKVIGAATSGGDINSKDTNTKVKTVSILLPTRVTFRK